MDLKTALHKLGYTKSQLSSDRVIEHIPSIYASEDFVELFLKHLTIIGDSREQKDWIEKACRYYGVYFDKAVKDKKGGTENLKEGDYSFKLVFGDRELSYVGVVAYERKGAISEIYNNLKSGDRERVDREFNRFIDKQYRKVVMVLEYGENLTDLLNAEFSYIDHNGMYNTKSVNKLVYSSLMAWKQENAKNFEIYQNENHEKMYWWILTDMFYWWRNEILNQAKEIENEKKENN